MAPFARPKAREDSVAGGIIAVGTVFGLVLMHGFFRILDRASAKHRHVVEMVKVAYKELATLGLVAFIMTIIQATNVFPPDSSELHEFESIHVMLFILAISFLMSNMALVLFSLSIANEWEAMEMTYAFDLAAYSKLRARFVQLQVELGLRRGMAAAGQAHPVGPALEGDAHDEGAGEVGTGGEAVPATAVEVVAGRGSHTTIPTPLAPPTTLSPGLGPSWWWHTLCHPRIMWEYTTLLTKVRFLEQRYKFLRRNELPSDFSFTAYLRKCKHHVFRKLVDIPVSVWAGFGWVIMVDMYLRALIPGYASIVTPVVIILFGCAAVLLLSLLMWWKIRRVYWAVLHMRFTRRSVMGLGGAGHAITHHAAQVKAQKSLFWFGLPVLLLRLMQVVVFGGALVVALAVKYWWVFEDLGTVWIPILIGVVVVGSMLLLRVVVPLYIVTLHTGELVDMRLLVEAVDKQRSMERERRARAREEAQRARRAAERGPVTCTHRLAALLNAYATRQALVVVVLADFFFVSLIASQWLSPPAQFGVHLMEMVLVSVLLLDQVLLAIAESPQQRFWSGWRACWVNWWDATIVLASSIASAISFVDVVRVRNGAVSHANAATFVAAVVGLRLLRTVFMLRWTSTEEGAGGAHVPPGASSRRPSQPVANDGDGGDAAVDGNQIVVAPLGSSWGSFASVQGAGSPPLPPINAGDGDGTGRLEKAGPPSLATIFAPLSRSSGLASGAPASDAASRSPTTIAPPPPHTTLSAHDPEFALMLASRAAQGYAYRGDLTTEDEDRHEHLMHQGMTKGEGGRSGDGSGGDAGHMDDSTYSHATLAAAAARVMAQHLRADLSHHDERRGSKGGRGQVPHLAVAPRSTIPHLVPETTGRDSAHSMAAMTGGKGAPMPPPTATRATIDPMVTLTPEQRAQLRAMADLIGGDALGLEGIGEDEGSGLDEVGGSGRWAISPPLNIKVPGGSVVDASGSTLPQRHHGSKDDELPTHRYVRSPLTHGMTSTGHGLSPVEENATPASSMHGDVGGSRRMSDMVGLDVPDDEGGEGETLPAPLADTPSQSPTAPPPPTRTSTASTAAHAPSANSAPGPPSPSHGGAGGGAMHHSGLKSNRPPADHPAPPLELSVRSRRDSDGDGDDKWSAFLRRAQAMGTPGASSGMAGGRDDTEGDRRASTARIPPSRHRQLSAEFGLTLHGVESPIPPRSGGGAGRDLGWTDTGMATRTIGSHTQPHHRSIVHHTTGGAGGGESTVAMMATVGGGGIHKRPPAVAPMHRTLKDIFGASESNGSAGGVGGTTMP